MIADALSAMQRIQATLDQLGAPPAPVSTSRGSSAAFDDIVASLKSTAGASSEVPATTSQDDIVTRDDVVASAKRFEGVPYVFGGESTKGIDCSGLVQRTYGDLGIDLPRLVSGQMKEGREISSLAKAKPGDLIVLSGGDHIAIYLGNNMVIHAPYPGRTVSVQKLWVGDSGITTIRRILPDPPKTPAPAALAAPAAMSPQATAAKMSALLESIMFSSGTPGATSGTVDTSLNALLAQQAAFLGSSR